MKNRRAALAAMAVVLAFAGCAKQEPASTTTTAAETTTAATTAAAEQTTTTASAAAETENTETAEADAQEGGVMSYAEYAAAAVDTPVTVETYVQAKQSWWEDNGVGQASFYTQDEDGGYFLYNMPCTKEEYDALVPGTKIRVSGFKAEWSGETEIIDTKFEIIDGNYIAEPVDVTSLLGNTDELIKYQNCLVRFSGMHIIPSLNADGEEAGFLYKWDGSGADGDDLYFKAEAPASAENSTFTVESYLCDNTTQVYADVKELTPGTVVDMVGFLYWYEGPNPHIIAVTPSQGTADAPAAETPAGVMSYAEYAAAAVDTPVTVETYVQAKQSWWEDNGVGQASFYTQDEDGGYFLYNMPCTKEQYDALVPGTKIRVSGYKAEWSGEVEIIDSTFEVIDGNYIAEPVDVTAFFDNEEELAKYQNRLVSFNGVKMMPSLNADSQEVPYLYKWDGSGAEGDDLYFKASYNGLTRVFTVESYLCGPDTDVYQAVKNLDLSKVGNMVGFLYWYEGPNPHIISLAQ